MKYKKGDYIYLKGQITGVSSCSEASFPYEVNTADEFIDVREDDIASVNEPEKPILPQFMDYWIQGAKYNGFDLYEAMTDDEMPDKVATWIVCNPETFAKAWIYGYEVEKEKLYTARLKLLSAKKYSYINKDKDEKTLFISDSDGLTDVYQTHFTQAELEELDVWNNPAFEIEEV